MRWATVGAVVRNARAISSVVRPHTSRSVSATCASGVSAGWQHVKISRSRSSSSSSPSFTGIASAARFQLACELAERSVEAGAAASGVDGLEASGRDQPGARIGGHAVARPLLHRRHERLVHRLLGAVEVAEQPDERGQDTARLGAIDRFDGRSRVHHPTG